MCAAPFAQHGQGRGGKALPQRNRLEASSWQKWAPWMRLGASRGEDVLLLQAEPPSPALKRPQGTAILPGAWGLGARGRRPPSPGSSAPETEPPPPQAADLPLPAHLRSGCPRGGELGLLGPMDSSHETPNPQGNPREGGGGQVRPRADGRGWGGLQLGTREGGTAGTRRAPRTPPGRHLDPRVTRRGHPENPEGRGGEKPLLLGLRVPLKASDQRGRQTLDTRRKTLPQPEAEMARP